MQNSWVVCDVTQQNSMLSLDGVFAWLFGGRRNTPKEVGCYIDLHRHLPGCPLTCQEALKMTSGTSGLTEGFLQG